MQSRELAGESQPEPRTGGSRVAGNAMEPLEDMRLGSRRDRAAGVADDETDIAISPLRGNSDAAADPIVLSRVLQEVLHNQRCVLLFPCHVQFGWNLFFDFHFR